MATTESGAKPGAGVKAIDAVTLKLFEPGVADIRETLISSGTLGCTVFTTNLKYGGKRPTETTLVLSREQMLALRNFLTANLERFEREAAANPYKETTEAT